ncbi:hypothetical protein M404DRAFT_36024 [Pisolithus tinctorius Marx 270]|uniref:Uncharacterized protein n=1 Tax=Pisolithus tinctorius Marx 270 TaxID=870435 RepID=A0A0C3ND74_PISTI|nr:hypothetical protein M404DRAFT_36024 [Pisolithus tinctorius Marx 270]
MSANHAPRLSQLVHAPTPDPAEAEKASLREQLAAASAGLVAEAKCVPDDWEDMREEKTTWLRCWEEKMVVLMPLVEQGKALGVSVQVDAEDAPTLAEADNWYKRWTVEEAEACTKAEQDVQMGEETVAEVGNKGAGLKMSHVEVPQLAHKTIAESEDEAGPRVTILPGSVLHKVPCARCSVKNTAGASIARSSKAPKAGPSKRAHNNDDNDIVEVVESRTRGKGKTSGRSAVSNKTATDLSQALAMVRAEAVAAHAANLRLQVRIEQLAEALAEHGIE